LRTRERASGKRGSARPRQGHANHAKGQNDARRGRGPRAAAGWEGVGARASRGKGGRAGEEEEEAEGEREEKGRRAHLGVQIPVIAVSNS
jgi:hypothetical protein